jgi:hypothetical protein
MMGRGFFEKFPPDVTLDLTRADYMDGSNSIRIPATFGEFVGHLVLPFPFPDAAQPLLDEIHAERCPHCNETLE